MPFTAAQIQNIANAATPGYTRQRVDLESIGGPGVPAFWSRYDGVGEGVKVTGATISGSIDVTSLGERHVSVDADMQKVRPDGTVVDGTWDAEYQWTDASYTVVSSAQTLTIDGHTATRNVTGLSWDKDERAPSAGTVTFSGFRGRTWTLVYAEVDGQHTVTVTRPNGQSRTFVIGGDGASVE